MRNGRRALAVVRLGSIVLVLAAIVVQVATLVEAGVFDPTRFFAFFTVQSNLIGVGAFVWLLAAGRGPRSGGLERLRGAAVVVAGITAAFLVLAAIVVGIVNARTRAASG